MDKQIGKEIGESLAWGYCCDRQEIVDGFVYTFDGSDQALESVMEMIGKCRGFFPNLKFELTVQGVGRPIRLRITGPDGVGDALGRLSVHG